MFQYLGDYLIELISLLLPLSLIGIVVLIAIILIQYYFYLNFIKRYKLIKKIYDKIYDKSLKLKHVNYNEIKACFKNEQEVQEITTEIMRRKFILGLLLKIDYFINKIFWKKKLSFMQDNLSDKQQLVYRSVRLLKLFPLIVISFILAVILLAIIIVILNKFMLTFFIFAFIFIFLIIFVVSYFSYLDFKKRVAKEKDLIKLNKQIKDEIERNRQLAIGIIVLIGILGFAAFFILPVLNGQFLTELYFSGFINDILAPFLFFLFMGIAVYLSNKYFNYKRNQYFQDIKKQRSTQKEK